MAAMAGHPVAGPQSPPNSSMSIPHWWKDAVLRRFRLSVFVADAQTDRIRNSLGDREGFSPQISRGATSGT